MISHRERLLTTLAVKRSVVHGCWITRAEFRPDTYKLPLYVGPVFSSTCPTFMPWDVQVKPNRCRQLCHMQNREIVEGAKSPNSLILAAQSSARSRIRETDREGTSGSQADRYRQRVSRHSVNGEAVKALHTAHHLAPHTSFLNGV